MEVGFCRGFVWFGAFLDLSISTQGRSRHCTIQKEAPLMIRLTIPFMALLAACAAPTASPNPNSVPLVLESMTQARAMPGALYVMGGLYDGAAAGQTARFVVTPDDGLLCTFQRDPVGDAVGSPTVRAYRENRPGLYADMTAVVLPNVAQVEVEFTTNFTVEHRDPAGLTVTQTGFGDPRFEQIRGVFAAYPSACWAFG